MFWEYDYYRKVVEHYKNFYSELSFTKQAVYTKSYTYCCSCFQIIKTYFSIHMIMITGLLLPLLSGVLLVTWLLSPTSSPSQLPLSNRKLNPSFNFMQMAHCPARDLTCLRVLVTIHWVSKFSPIGLWECNVLASHRWIF